MSNGNERLKPPHVPNHFDQPYKPIVEHHEEPGGLVDQDTHHNRTQHPHRPAADLSQFWVITIISNPVRYKRRYELYWKFKRMCEEAGVNLITVEQTFGHRPFMVTRPDNPMHLQVRTVEELWHKENMINMGVRHACAIAPGRVREIAWVDADCRPAFPAREWFEETWHSLQHYQFVQMWENLIDLDPDHNAIGLPQPGFMSNYIKYGSPNPEEFHRLQSSGVMKKLPDWQHGKHGHHSKPGHHGHKHGHHGHGHHKHHHGHHHHHDHGHYPYDDGGKTTRLFGRPGLAWAANVDAWNHVGGLIDFCILGAGDWYMAHALVGAMSPIVSAKLGSQRYADKLLQWQELAERWIKRDVGFVPGTVVHDFHGAKKNRFYGSRGQILSSCEYNPDTDVKFDHHGLLQLETWTPRQIQLRDRVRAYFRARNEDSIDL